MRSKIFAAAVTALALSAGTAPAANLVVNGGFELLSGGPSGADAGRSFELGNRHIYGQALTGWTTTDSATSRPPAPGVGLFNVLFQGTSGRAATDDALTRYTSFEPQRLNAQVNDGGRVNGGNFVGIDADTFANGPLFQTISGLIVGATYRVSFEWASAQYSNRDVFPVPDNWVESGIQVSFGPSGFNGDGAPFNGGSAGGANQCDTPVLRQFGTNGVNGSASFSGWQQFSCTFTASAAVQVLSFLAVGAPNGQPPVALLDGVSLTQVPVPAALALFGAGLLGLTMVRRRRQAG
jgi:hypothetical protein